ncbi:MAG: type II secretion system protein GspM [Rhodospirillales bacterium]
MTLQQRDKRALAALAAAVCGVALFPVFSGRDTQPAVVGMADSIPAAEKRLARVRQRAAGVEGREQLLKKVSAELAEREKGIIQAETAAQAQAQLLNIIKRIAADQPAPIEFGSVEMSKQVAKIDGGYGEVQVSLPFFCHIEDLLNFLADLGNQPELLAAKEIRIATADQKQKTINVRLTVAAIVPGRLVPEKKGLY